MTVKSSSQMRAKAFRTALFAMATLGTAVLAWGQSPPSAAYEHEVVTPTGQRAHILFSAPVEQDYRAQEAAAAKAGGFAVTATNLVYGGGPVMRNPTNYLIFWQPPGRAAFPAGYQAGIEKFFQNVGGTPFYNIVTQYGDTSGVPVPNATSLGAPSFTDTTTAPPSGCNGLAQAINAAPNCPLTDGDIRNEVNVAIAANPAWTAPGINVMYFVFTPSDVSECFNSTNCFAVTGQPNGTFCAYHSSFGARIYAYQPFASAGSCYPSAAIQNLGYPTGVAVDVVLGEVEHEMIESNTDPFGNGWTGTGGGDDEIGDKCNFVFGYVAPDGTNIVLNGNRFKIQEEFSNDVTACTKRYGPAPVTANPGPVPFGEVEAGTSREQNLLIQNNGGGALNILNIRLGPGSSPFYSLLNVQPTAATIQPSESLTANIQFAPPSSAPFGSPTGTVVVDTDETPCGLNQSCATPSSTTFANITGTVGVPPTALCKNVIVPTDPNLCSAANASINNGSFDPDGEAITLTQSPDAPYTLGTTGVTLTVTDTFGISASCTGVITVQDLQPPSITCPAAQTVQCTSSSGAAVALNPTFSDNCPGATASCSPTSGSTFGFGTTPVTCAATDTSGNTTLCSTSVTVVDVPPVISSVVASPNVLLPPNKKLKPVAILVQDSDICDPSPVCSITSVDCSFGTCPANSFVITGPLTLELQANGNGGHPFTYIITVTCADAHGGSTSAQTPVAAPGS